MGHDIYKDAFVMSVKRLFFFALSELSQFSWNLLFISFMFHVRRTIDYGFRVCMCYLGQSG